MGERRFTNSIWFAGFVCWLAIFSLPSRTADGAIRTIAYSGLNPFATGEGVSFQSFAIPSLNNRGDVVFTASLAGEGVSSANDTSLWFGARGGSLQAIAREGATAAGLPEDALFGSFTNTFVSGAALNDSGQYAFAASVVMPGSGTQTGILTGELNQSLNTLALSGAIAPGAAGGASYYISPSMRPTINRQGVVAFLAQLTGAYMNPPNNGADGIWRGPFDGTVEPVVLIKEAAPGLGDEATIVDLGAANWSVPINSAGTLAIRGAYGLAGPTSWNGHALWSITDEEFKLVAQSGTQWPDLGPNAILSPTWSIGGVDGTGRIAFQGNYSNAAVGTGFGGFIGVSGSDGLEVVAHVSGDAPEAGADMIFAYLHNQPVISSEGDVAFYGSIVNTRLGSRPGTGLWAGKAGDLKLIAWEGGPTPGLNGAFLTFTDDLPAINRFGQVAFANVLTGQVSGQSLWATDLAGNLVLIARGGEVIEVAPGDERVIGTVSMISGHGDDDGRARGLNDWGEVAFLARFTDGTSGVFVSDAAAKLPGDYDGNGVVDAADYTVWRDAVASQNLIADGDRNGAVDEQDYLLWKEFYGFSRDVAAGSAAMQSVPEPSAAGMIVVGAILWGGGRRRRLMTRD